MSVIALAADADLRDLLRSVASHVHVQVKCSEPRDARSAMDAASDFEHGFILDAGALRDVDVQSIIPRAGRIVVLGASDVRLPDTAEIAALTLPVSLDRLEEVLRWLDGGGPPAHYGVDSESSSASA